MVVFLMASKNSGMFKSNTKRIFVGHCKKRKAFRRRSSSKVLKKKESLNKIKTSIDPPLVRPFIVNFLGLCYGLVNFILLS